MGEEPDERAFLDALPDIVEDAHGREIRAGFEDALRIAARADERRRWVPMDPSLGIGGSNPHDLPFRISLPEIAEMRGLKETDVLERILRARHALVGASSDRAVRRWSQRARERDGYAKHQACEDCGCSLPPRHHPSGVNGTPRRFCADCSTPKARKRRQRRRSHS